MGFGEAIGSCFSKYATFSGRACRSEYWFFVLFDVILSFIGGILHEATGVDVFGLLISVLLFLPGLAVSVRRLHDIDRFGWWLLLGFVPVIGWIVLLVWNCTKGSPGANRFGPDPLPAVASATA